MEELLAKAEGLCQELSDGAYRSILEMSHFPGVTYFGTAVLVTRSPEESLDQLTAYGQALREAGVARIEPAQMLPELNAAQDRLRLTVESRHLDRDGRLIGTSAYRLYGDYREGRAGLFDVGIAAGRHAKGGAIPALPSGLGPACTAHGWRFWG